MSNFRWMFSLVLGVIMIGLGVYIALSPQLPVYRVSTGSRWLDAAFSLFFLLRGWVNVRSALRLKQRAP